MTAPVAAMERTAPPSHWQGFYVGGSVGSAIGADNQIGRLFDLRRDPAATPASGYGGGIGVVDGRTEFNSLFSGLHVGYNWLLAGAIAGLEGELGNLGAGQHWLASLRGRIGIARQDLHLYGTAGLGYLSLDGGLSTVNLGGAGGNGSAGGSGRFPGRGGDGGFGVGEMEFHRYGKSQAGFVAGLGAEYKLSPSVAIGVEGLYYHFGDELERAGYDSDFYLLRGRLSIALDDRSRGMDSRIARGDWSGFHLGAHGGTLLDTRQDTINGARLTPGEAGGAGANGTFIDPLDGAGGGGGGGGGGAAVALMEKDKISLLGGVQAGYTWQRQQLVYGVEADASFGARDRDYLASLRGRVGHAWSSHWAYLTGGVAFTRMSGIEAILVGSGGHGSPGGNSVNLGGDGSGGAGGAGGLAAAIAGNRTLTGFVIGAGIDTQIAKNLTIGLEGLYYGFDGQGANLARLQGFDGSAFGSRDNSDAFVLRTRLSMRF